MPRDLFGDVTNPSIKLGTRKWYSVPLSFAAHTCALGALVVTPLIATGALPMPSSGAVVVLLEPPPLPEPPPIRRATPAQPTPPVSRDAAPTVAPATIAPEPAFDPGFENQVSSDIGVVGGSEVAGTAVITPPPAVVAPPAPSKPVRAGGDVRVPQRVSYVAPTYPALALAARVRGLVIIEATIDPNGRVQDAKVLRSDSPLLNESALTAVRQWVYTPTLLNGIPVSVVMTVTVHFQMQ